MKVAIIVFGFLIVALGSINRLVLQNVTMSAIIVTLIIVWVIVLVWFSIHTRKITFKRVPEHTKHV